MSSEVEVLTNVLILRKVFKNLTARQLNTCCKVCKLWSEEALREKTSRNQIHWNSFSLEDRLGDASTIQKSFERFLRESPIEPVAALIFCSESLCAELEDLQKTNEDTASARKRRKKLKEVSHAVLPEIMPRSCKTHIAVTDGVVGTDESNKIEEYDECESALSVVLFGAHWDLRLYPFSCTHSQCQAMLQYWAQKANSIPECFSCLRKEEVKMFNLFCPINGVDQELGYSLFRMFDWPLVAGGNVSARFLKDGDSSWCSTCSNCVLSGLAVCGQSVRVASVLIRSHVDTEDQVDTLMAELAAHDLPLQQSLGLMYACVGRGIHVYDGKHNVESKIFRKYFPKTPLLGFFGNGEIGCDFPQPDSLFVPNHRTGSGSSSSSSGDSEDSKDSDSRSRAMVKRQIAERKKKDMEFKMKHPPKLMHAYTTVMCLISVDK